MSVVPKRGVLVMRASRDGRGNALDLRSILEEEGARRLIENSAVGAFEALHADHRAVIEAARVDVGPGLVRRAIAVSVKFA